MSVGGGEFYTAIFLGGTGRQKAGEARVAMHAPVEGSDWVVKYRDE